MGGAQYTQYTLCQVMYSAADGLFVADADALMLPDSCGRP